ncbi:MAG: hypothetical protein C5B43_03030 [Verrucomicrobia bacterium]|nr:MAG: hypothetical protein C5B43_03030 [Verrucomicrobiota bacterium]
MGNKERYLIFGIGVLIGSIILAISYTGKYKAIKKQEEEDKRKGFVEEKVIFPGQDLTAKKPYDVGPALFTQDLEEGKNGQFTRIIIADGSGKKRELVRIVETLWRDPENKKREKLIRRQLMAADRVVVRLKEGSDEDGLMQLKEEIKNFGMEFLEAGKGSRLYKVKFNVDDTHTDALPKIIEALLAKSNLFEAVFPDYMGHM